MMDIREKLVELLEEIDATADEDCGIDKYTGGRVVSVHGAEYIADHLDFLTGTGERIADENLLCERKRKVKVYVRKGKKTYVGR